MEQTVEEAEHFHSHQFTVHRQLDEKTRFRTVVVEDGSNIGVVALLQEQSHLEEHGVVFDEEGEDELFVFLWTAHEHESDCLVELANEGVEEGFEVEGGLVDFDQEEDGDLFVAEFEYLESVVVEVGFQFLGFGVGVSSQVLRESGEFNDWTFRADKCFCFAFMDFDEYFFVSGIVHGRFIWIFELGNFFQLGVKFGGVLQQFFKQH